MDFGAQMLGAWMLVAVLGLCVWVFRKKNLASMLGSRLPRTGQRRMEVIERLVLTPNHSLHLVRLADQMILVGVAPSGCTVMQSLPATAIGRTATSGEIS